MAIAEAAGFRAPSIFTITYTPTYLPFYDHLTAALRKPITGPERCAVCHAEEPAMNTFKKCRGCKAVVYCGKACQKKDWKTHKKVCNKK